MESGDPFIPSDHQTHCGRDALNVGVEIRGAMAIHLQPQFRTVQLHRNLRIQQPQFRPAFGELRRVIDEFFDIRSAEHEADVGSRSRAAQVDGLDVVNLKFHVLVWRQLPVAPSA